MYAVVGNHSIASPQNHVRDTAYFEVFLMFLAVPLDKIAASRINHGISDDFI